jgi:hypothetical protein
MEITIYCSSCGAKHSIETVKPKFCSACGEPINKAFKKDSPKPMGSMGAKSREVIEDNNEEIFQGSLSDFEVIVKRKLTLGDLSKIETPISRGNGSTAGLPSDVEVTSKNFFADLDQ